MFKESGWKLVSILICSMFLTSCSLISTTVTVQPGTKWRDELFPEGIPNLDVDQDLNNYVLYLVTTYEGIDSPYLLSQDYEHYNGVTMDLYYQSKILARANPDGSRSCHCVGLTFETFFRAMQERNKRLGIDTDNFNNLTFDDLFDFLLTWYVAKGPKVESNVAVAIEKYGFGKRIIEFEDAKPGDFMDINRVSGSGHTVVFIRWLRGDDNKIIGLRYWSSQKSTNGLGFNEEYFIDSSKEVKSPLRRDMLYIGRVGPVKEYKSRVIN